MSCLWGRFLCFCRYFDSKSHRLLYISFIGMSEAEKKKTARTGEFIQYLYILLM
ncbi:MAG: hypothetical protein GX878_11545, partial [Firmicutes bacterium]|nr:hypothetical protein [Bacillota bacterium]